MHIPRVKLILQLGAITVLVSIILGAYSVYNVYRSSLDGSTIQATSPLLRAVHATEDKMLLAAGACDTNEQRNDPGQREIARNALSVANAEMLKVERFAPALGYARHIHALDSAYKNTRAAVLACVGEQDPTRDVPPLVPGDARTQAFTTAIDDLRETVRTDRDTAILQTRERLKNTLQHVVFMSVIGTLALIVTVVVLVHAMKLQAEARCAALSAYEQAKYLLQSSSDMVALIKDGGEIAFVNSAVKFILGRERESVIGRSIYEFFPEEELSSVMSVVEHAKAAPGRSGPFEVQLKSKDGTPVALEVMLNNLLAEPGIGALVINARDVSERKRAAAALQESEEKVRDLLDNTLDPIHSLNPDATFRYVNRSWQKTLGYTETELRGITIFDVVATEDIDFARERFRRLTRKESIGDYRIRLRAKDGRILFFEGRTSWRFDGDTPVYTRTILRDITKRHELEKIKDEFISVVSHELRTPLTSIRGSLGLLASGRLRPDSPQSKTLLEVAARNTDRLVNLINDILDLERLQTGKIPMTFEPCSVRQLATESMETVQSMADGAKIGLRCIVVDGYVRANQHRMMQTLTNLLSNAIKFSEPGSEVILSASPVDGQFEFSVQDHGRGIPEDKVEQIFERFQQVDASDSRVKGGTGLGLAICRTIVNQHGGRIWATSKLGVGSTFHVRIPVEIPVENVSASLPIGALPEGIKATSASQVS